MVIRVRTMHLGAPSQLQKKALQAVKGTLCLKICDSEGVRALSARHEGAGGTAVYDVIHNILCPI